MQRFVSAEIAKLVDLAYGGRGGRKGNIAKLVTCCSPARTTRGWSRCA